MHSVGILDRTGELLPLVEDLSSRLDGQLTVVVLDHRKPIPSDVNLTFLLVGPKEGSHAALLKVRRYLNAHPATLAAASGIPANAADRNALLASGIRHVSRSRPTTKQIVRLLGNSMRDLDRLSNAIEHGDGSGDGDLETLEDEHWPQAETNEIEEVSATDESDTAAEVSADAETDQGFVEIASDDDMSDEQQIELNSDRDVELDAQDASYDLDAEDAGYDLAPVDPDELKPIEQAASVAVSAPNRNGGAAKLVTVASATGGCGKTFFATNLAMLAAKSGQRCLLVDLDLQFGEVATALRISHPYSVYDGLYDGDGRRLPIEALHDHLGELTYHHSLGFDVLTAPRDPALSDYVGARDADEILDTVLPLYDIVIIDTPPSLNEVVLVALDRSDVVSIMATLDVPSLKNLAIFLDTLKRLSISDTHVQLVLNKTEADVGMKVSQAQDAFNGRFISAIPASRAVSRSINAGTVVTATEPRSQVARRTVQAAAIMLPGMILTEVTSRVPWWRRLFSKNLAVIPVEQGI